MATLEQRVAHLHEQYITENNAPAPEPAGEAAGAAPSPAPATAPPADSAADPVADRRARLAKLQAEERERVDRRSRQADTDKLTKDLEAAQKRVEEAEARATARIDRETLRDPMKVMAIMQEEGVPANRIAEAIREAMANPEHAAAAAAKRAVDPELKALKERVELAERRLQEAESRRAMAEQQMAETRAAQEFFQFTTDSAAAAPHAAAALKHFGPERYYELAFSACKHLPPNSGWQAVLDVIEEQLSGFAPVFATHSNEPAQPPARPAAAKAKPLSNTLAQERASVAEPEDWASLSYEERVERLKTGRR